jgi:hypothetical protein
MLAASARKPSKLRRTAHPYSTAAHAVWNATATATEAVRRATAAHAVWNATATATEAVRRATPTDAVWNATTAPETVWASASTPETVPATSLRISTARENGSYSNDAQDLDL